MHRLWCMRTWMSSRCDICRHRCSWWRGRVDRQKRRRISRCRNCNWWHSSSRRL